MNCTMESKMQIFTSEAVGSRWNQFAKVFKIPTFLRHSILNLLCNFWLVSNLLNSIGQDSFASGHSLAGGLSSCQKNGVGGILIPDFGGILVHGLPFFGPLRPSKTTFFPWKLKWLHNSTARTPEKKTTFSATSLCGIWSFGQSGLDDHEFSKKFSL